MVKKFFGFINKESNGLHQAAYFLAIFALLSQILGLLRDRLLAHNFGAGLELDIYYAAFRLPDFLFVSVASLVSISVLIPVLVESFEKKEDCKNFINNIFSFFFFIIIIFSIIIFLLAPVILKVVFPGFPSDSYPNLVLLTRILLLSPIFLGISNLLGSIVQAKKRFVLYALSPVVYNIGIILGILLLVPYMGILGVVLGVIAGSVGHFAIQVPFVFKARFLPAFIFKWLWSDIRKILKLSIPRTLALSLNHLSLIFLFSFASLLAVGSISIFNLSFNLQSIPLSIIGVSYSLAAFPMLSRFFVNKEYEKFAREITTATKHIIFWSLPIAVLFIVLRAQIVRVILGSGQFSWSDTRLTAAALAIFSVSIVCQSLNVLFVRGYYYTRKTRKPLLINAIGSALVVIFGFVLMKIFQQNDFFRFFMENLLRVEDLKGSVILMLPLGYSLGMVINTFMLWFLFRLDFKKIRHNISGPLFQSFSASIIMGFTAYLSLNFFALWFDLGTLFGIFFQGFLSGIIAITFGISILVILDNAEIKEIWKNLHKRFWRVKVIGPDPDVI